MSKPVLRIDSRGWWWRVWGMSVPHGPFKSAADAYRDLVVCARIDSNNPWCAIRLAVPAPPSFTLPLDTH